MEGGGGIYDDPFLTEGRKEGGRLEMRMGGSNVSPKSKVARMITVAFLMLILC